ncbi:hypothetical protein COOONC_18562 [Cooperia oncophora]
MWSSFSSFSPHVYSPGVYKPSQINRGNPGSSTSSVRLDSPSSPSGTTHRDSPLSRDYLNEESARRDSLPGSSRFSFRRLSDDRKFADNAGTPRVTLDGETSSLLERYGVRKASVTETSAQSYLKQRRQQQPDSNGGSGAVRRKSGDVGIEATAISGGDLFGNSISPSRPFNWKDTPRQTMTSVQDITQNEYLNRLLAAHNRVDDLLRSRGLSAEDESKYLRAWEEIPIIREERRQRVRTVSSSSDSGLSTDNDSDRSNADAVKNEEPTCEQQFSRPEATHSCSQTLRPCRSSLQSSLCCRELSSKPSTARVSFRRKPSSKQSSKALDAGPTHKESFDLKCTSPACITVSTSRVFKCKEKSIAAEKIFHISTKTEKAQLSTRVQTISAGPPTVAERQVKNTQKNYKPIQKEEHKKGANAKPATNVEKQRTVLVSFKRKPSFTFPCTAEISIQHCSFYQVSQRASEKPEKNVRMNLRLTERAPSKSSATTTLPTTSRPLFAYLHVAQKQASIPPTKNGQMMKQMRKIGKLDRSMTVEPQMESRQQRKVNRLVIPDFFLNSGTTENLKVDNQPKRVEAQLADGFADDSKQPSQLKRSNAIRRKAPPVLAFTTRSASSDHCEKQPLCAANLPPPDFGRTNSVQVSGPLNQDGSLDRTATTSGALVTTTDTVLAELSPVDRVLVEQFRRSKQIPRPKALVRSASSYEPRSRLQTPTPTVEFIQYNTPYRHPPPPQLASHLSPPSSPPSLRKAYRSVKHFSKRVHLLECPPLKKVDRAVSEKLKSERPKRWIPRWRKACSVDGSPEIEEEEEQEDEAKQSNNVKENDSSRLKTQDGNGNIEAEKAVTVSA